MLVGYRSVEAAAATVSEIIAAGIVPGRDRDDGRARHRGGREGRRLRLPAGAVAVLVIELDGPEVEVEAQFAQVEQIARQHDAFETRIAADAAERALMWKGRKSAFAAVGRISPSYFVQDGVIPRTKLPEVLSQMTAMADAVGLRVANVFHAGDGNLHPLVLFDDAVEGQAHDAEELAGSILELCIASGGSITGEHGVGPGEAPQDGEAVHARGPRHHAAGALRLRPGGHREPRQGLPDAAPVR
jgi:glycolate oxidase